MALIFLFSDDSFTFYFADISTYGGLAMKPRPTPIINLTSACHIQMFVDVMARVVIRMCFKIRLLSIRRKNEVFMRMAARVIQMASGIMHQPMNT